MGNFKENLINDLSNDEKIRNFLFENDISTDTLENSLSELLAFKLNINKCESCTSLLSCTQDIIGIKPGLKYENNQIKVISKECFFQYESNKKMKQSQLLSALYMPLMIEQANLKDYRTNTTSRLEIQRYIKSFLNTMKSSKKGKGMYLEGQYQRGKTYTLAALANELSKEGFKVIIAYYPDLVREFKTSISKGNLDLIIKKLKEVDVLMLDDIGGEAQSVWVRDEILGPILQHRLLDELPTFFSSNVERKELGKYLVTSDQRAEKMKAYRIVTRIISLTEEFKM